MNTSLRLSVASALVLASGALLRAEQAPEAPVPVTRIVTQEAPKPEAVRQENQRLYGPSSATIIPVDQAQALVARFKEAYVKLGSPRIVFFVNRQLVDTEAGVKLTARTEHYEQTKSEHKSETEKVQQGTTAPQTQVNVAMNGNAGSGTTAGLPQGKAEATTTTTRTSGDNTYAVKEGEKATLSDRQTVRDVERLFGRVFRAGGAALADQKVAADLIEDKGIANLTGTSDQAAKDRAALGQVADVAIEILVSSRQITVPAVSGDETATIPDIQATAIRLKDAAIIGQASASDILGKDRNAGTVIRNFDIRDITEATALALVEDMLGSVK
jgi:hypothetical protein